MARPRSGWPSKLHWPKWMRRDPCAFCGHRPAGELDHIDPVADGGRGRFDNATAICGPCNRAKGATPLLLFMLGRLRWR